MHGLACSNELEMELDDTEEMVDMAVKSCSDCCLTISEFYLFFFNTLVANQTSGNPVVWLV